MHQSIPAYISTCQVNHGYQNASKAYAHICKSQKVSSLIMILTTRPTSATTLSINCRLTSSPGWPIAKTCEKVRQINTCQLRTCRKAAICLRKLKRIKYKNYYQDPYWVLSPLLSVHQASLTCQLIQIQSLERRPFASKTDTKCSKLSVAAAQHIA